eukprot:gnl/Spiro4/14660_TR7898_c0_g1_i1.p2 gnl/Spiro4/14660_TR7898_c0_g1~~gnl/Spiro4/14660_TR7898_c0_g1_i1.p2  ORF type:complete len:111 (+),score=21.19 gnl/Spiro4/14660_TR7898_c0_g1_i1:46-333(+)
MAKRGASNFLLKIGCSSSNPPNFDQLRTIWAHYDQDDNNTLDRDEFELFFRDMCKLFGETFTEADFHTLWTAFDTNGDNVISWEEFTDGFEAGLV